MNGLEIANVVVLVVMIVISAVNVAWTFSIYRQWLEIKRRRELSGYLLHLELFSLAVSHLIIPEGEHPTDESEAKRFQNWRMN